MRLIYSKIVTLDGVRSQFRRAFCFGRIVINLSAKLSLFQVLVTISAIFL